MTLEQRAKMLEQAAVLVEHVTPELDQSLTRCMSCLDRHANNWQDYKFFPQLEAIARKLRIMADSFRTNPTGQKKERLMDER